MGSLHFFSCSALVLFLPCGLSGLFFLFPEQPALLLVCSSSTVWMESLGDYFGGTAVYFSRFVQVGLFSTVYPWCRHMGANKCVQNWTNNLYCFHVLEIILGYPGGNTAVGVRTQCWEHVETRAGGSRPGRLLVGSDSLVIGWFLCFGVFIRITFVLCGEGYPFLFIVEGFSFTLRIDVI